MVHQHDLPHRHGSRTHLNLLWPVLLTLGFALVEAVGGWLTHSLALLGDAGHMFSDSAALALAWFAAWVAQRPPSKRHTYGLARVEVLVALFNGLLMLMIIFGIVQEAIHRLSSPREVAGGQVMVIAFIGLLVNIGVAYALNKSEKNINSRAAMLHVMGDLLGSVAALAAGAVIYFTGWVPIDAILSILISGLLLISTTNLLREAVHVLMEGVPENIDPDAVEREMSKMPGVNSIHDVHIWTLASGVVALSAHVVLNDLHGWMHVLPDMREMLDQRYGINHVTLQPETEEWLEQKGR
jgi:cobalt-zinc-cadmium efflux system protein